MKTQTFNVQFTGRAINFDSSHSFYTRCINAAIEVPCDLDGSAQVKALEVSARGLYLDDIEAFVKEKLTVPVTEENVNLEVQLLTSFNWRPSIQFNEVSCLN
jgi:hypothetical protein